jgi:hypothetical protein
MPIFRTYLCPDCSGTFEVLHMSRADPAPDVCELCAADLSEPTIVPGTHNISSARSASIDSVYTKMESASSARAELAAEVAGGSAADYSQLKITDLKTNILPGEVAASLPPTPVVPSLPPGMGMVDNTAAVEYSRSTRIGPEAGAGMRSMDMMRQKHSQYSAAFIRQGQSGSHK